MITDLGSILTFYETVLFEILSEASPLFDVQGQHHPDSDPDQEAVDHQKSVQNALGSNQGTRRMPRYGAVCCGRLTSEPSWWDAGDLKNPKMPQNHTKRFWGLHTNLRE